MWAYTTMTEHLIIGGSLLIEFTQKKIIVY